MFKTHQIITLSSKQAKLGMLYKRFNSYEEGFAVGIITNAGFVDGFNKGYLKNNNLTSPQHLYILSENNYDFELNKEYWVLTTDKRIVKYKGYNGNSEWKVIIATTDEKLNLPLINQKFIEEFSFKGIDNTLVNVEYTSIGTNEDELGVPVNYEEIEEKFILKIKDNYVDNIQFQKNNWNKEELRKVMLAFHNSPYLDVDEWLKDNLNSVSYDK